MLQPFQFDISLLDQESSLHYMIYQWASIDTFHIFRCIKQIYTHLLPRET